jgi:hypothetical protein
MEKLPRDDAASCLVIAAAGRRTLPEAAGELGKRQQSALPGPRRADFGARGSRDDEGGVVISQPPSAELAAQAASVQLASSRDNGGLAPGAATASLRPEYDPPLLYD